MLGRATWPVRPSLAAPRLASRRVAVSATPAHTPQEAPRSASSASQASQTAPAPIVAVLSAASAPTEAAAAIAAAAEEEEEGELAYEPELDARAVVASVTAAVQERPWVKGVLVGSGLFLAATLAFSAFKVYLRFNSGRSVRRRQVGKNLVVVQALDKYLPAQRARLTPAVVRALAVRTGFSRDALFRKHLRYILNERPFDTDAVHDILALRDACGLTQAATEEMLKETAQRTFKATGILMRRPRGMTAEGLARKTQGRALFSKLLYLAEAETEGLLESGSRESTAQALMAVFGATSEDADALRIASLHQMSAEQLDRLWGEQGDGSEEADAVPKGE